MTTYHWLRVRAEGRSWTESYASFGQRELPAAELWGAFYGLFGIGSNELVLVINAEGGAPIQEVVTKAGFEVIGAHELVPTVRPERFEPRSRPGLYVFRLFEVDHGDVDEIAGLSNKAWTSFENTEGYAAEAQGLFAQADRSAPNGVMVLLTWYESLDSWERSRGAAPEAAANFRRRRALTRRTIAYATRLVGT